MDNLRVMMTEREAAVIRRIAAEVHHAYCQGEGPSTLSREDLYHYGVIGLLEAKRKFDKSRSVPWLVFAAFRVRGAMIDQLRVQPLVRLPQAVRQKVNAVKAAVAELGQDGTKPDTQCLADHLRWPVSEVHRVMGLALSHMHLAESREEGDDDAEERGFVLIDPTPGPEELTLRKEVARLVRRCLAALPSPEDRLVITGRLMEGLKLREIAETLGCSAENVRLRQQKLQKQLKTCLQQQGWRPEP
jgi:RNA polymerase sigma factor for flagellar operon FliA